MLCACSQKDYNPQLLAVEHIIEEHPDSALTLIEHIDTASLNSEADKALYGLLIVQARTKCDYTESDDSLIAPAIDCFRERHDKQRLMKALFYGATTAYNRRELNEAIVRGLESRDIAISLADDYWRAKAAELIADVFQKSFLYSEGLKYRKEAVEYYKLAGKERNHRFAICDYIYDRYNNGDNGTQLTSVLDSITIIARTEQTDSALLNYSISYTFLIYIDNHENAKAAQLYDEFKTLINRYPYVFDYVNCATLCVWLGDYDKAEEYLNAAEQIAEYNTDHAFIANCYSYFITVR